MTRVYSIYFGLIQTYLPSPPLPRVVGESRAVRDGWGHWWQNAGGNKCCQPWPLSVISGASVSLSIWNSKKGHLPSPQLLTHLRNGLHQRGFLGIVTCLWGKAGPVTAAVLDQQTLNVYLQGRCPICDYRALLLHSRAVSMPNAPFSGRGYIST